MIYAIMIALIIFAYIGTVAIFFTVANLLEWEMSWLFITIFFLLWWAVNLLQIERKKRG